MRKIGVHVRGGEMYVQLQTGVRNRSRIQTSPRCNRSLVFIGSALNHVCVVLACGSHRLSTWSTPPLINMRRSGLQALHGQDASRAHTTHMSYHQTPNPKN